MYIYNPLIGTSSSTTLNKLQSLFSIE